MTHIPQPSLRPHPERPGDIVILTALRALCGKSHVTYAVEGYPIMVGHFAPDLVGKPRFIELNIVQMDFRMEACAKHGLRHSVLIRHRDKNPGESNVPYTEHHFPFCELSWPSLREIYEASLLYGVSAAGLGGKGRAPKQIIKD